MRPWQGFEDLNAAHRMCGRMLVKSNLSIICLMQLWGS